MKQMSRITFGILKSFSTLNQNIIFKPGNVIKTRSESKITIAEAVIPDSFGDTIGIYDLSRFINTVNLIEADSKGDVLKSNFEVKPSSIIIKNGRHRMEYATSEETVLNVPDYNKGIDYHIEDEVSIAEFTITADTFKNIQKAASIIPGNTKLLTIQCDEDASSVVLNISESQLNANNKDVYKIQLEEDQVEVVHTDNTSIYFISAFNLMPLDYKVTIFSSVILFESLNEDYKVRYLICAQEAD